MAKLQISPGNALSPSRLCPPHLRTSFPYRYRTLKRLASSSSLHASYAISVSSSQRFACGFLQIPPRDGHPCRPANDSPCRVRRRLSLPSKSALPGAPKQERRDWMSRRSVISLRRALPQANLRTPIKEDRDPIEDLPSRQVTIALDAALK